MFGKTDMTSWEGGIITSYVNEFENLDGHGHGVKLEPTCNVVSLALFKSPSIFLKEIPTIVSLSLISHWSWIGRSFIFFMLFPLSCSYSPMNYTRCEPPDTSNNG